MRIKAFQLQNLGRFTSLAAAFVDDQSRPAKVVVLVGGNGAGKTSILKAIATSLSWFVARVRSEKGSGSPIAEHAIGNGASSSAIEIQVSDDGAALGHLHWTLARVRQGIKGVHASDLADASRLADHYRQRLTDTGDSSLPLIAYYPVERSVLEVPLKVKKRNAFSQMLGYDDFMSSAVSFARFFEWFRDREDYENERNNQLLLSEDKISEVERLGRLVDDFDEDALDKIPVGDFKSMLKEFSKLQVVMEGLRNLSEASRDPQLSAVRSAVEHFMPGFSNLRVQRKPELQMVVDKNDQPLNILQLSQGEKSLMALVGDIARRLSMMNPSLADPLQGQGVVLIDEVDLHLHPAWQRQIIRNLTRTFPNCQFILTTHSPLVISDYPDVLVYALNDGQLDKVPSQFGQDANRVLLDVMDTHIRNPEVGSKLNDVMDSIQNADLELARQQIAALEALLPEPETNLELAKVRLLLRKQELRLEKDR